MASREDYEIEKSQKKHKQISEQECVPSILNVSDLHETEELGQYHFRFRRNSNTMDLENNEKSVQLDEDIFEGIDDSDEDPDFNVPNSNSSSSSGDLEKIASLIENNISEDTMLPDDSSITQISLQQNMGPMNKIAIKTKTGKIKMKECLPLTECKKHCKDKITYEQQLVIFNYYCHLSSYQSKASFVSRLIDMQPKKRTVLQRSLSSPRNRTHSNYYSLLLNGTKINVCQKCFLKTLGETESFLKTVCKKNRIFGGAVEDHRGKGPSANKLSEEKISEVQNHINLFPYYESHYTRRRSQKKYLQINLNLSTMYRLYSSSHSNPVSLTKYNEIFKGMGLKFKKPKTDTCFKCDKFKILISTAKSEDEKNNLIFQQSNHHKEADDAYNMKEADKKIAKNNLNKKVYAFDLEQCLPTPLLTSNVSFYKRQLWTFNLTVHNCASNSPFCYMWHEALAKRGGNEIASCIYQHLLSEPPNVDQVIFYSDGCVEQNKNSFMSVMFMIFLQSSTNIQIIDHKFLLTGHTHMECDVDHSIIERKKKRTNPEISHPVEWYQFVRQASSTRIFKVIEMNQDKIFNFSNIIQTKCMWRNRNADGDQFKWANVRWLRYSKQFGLIQYKNSLDEDETFKELNIRKRGFTKIDHSHLTKSYNGPVVINKQKKKDLIDQLPLINELYHDFYKKLKDSDSPMVDPDLSDDTECEEEDID